MGHECTHLRSMRTNGECRAKYAAAVLAKFQFYSRSQEKKSTGRTRPDRTDLDRLRLGPGGQCWVGGGGGGSFTLFIQQSGVF
jgi:hypothetical protein